MRVCILAAQHLYLWNSLNTTTWNSEERLCAVFHSCTVMGHTAELSTVLFTHSCNLQNSSRQESVPTRERIQDVRQKQETNAMRNGKRPKVLPSVISIRPWCGLVQPFVLGVHRTAVFLPADDRLWQTVDLALESSHTRLLSMDRLWLDMEVCHGCRGRERGISS